jgi:hypothetical protein
LVTNELPFFAGYLLVASLALALAQGDLKSVGGAIVGAAALVVLVGLAVVVRRSHRADAALQTPRSARRPWHRILLAPLPALRRDVVRVGNISYGDGPRRNLDVYPRRDRPTGVPVAASSTASATGPQPTSRTAFRPARRPHSQLRRKPGRVAAMKRSEFFTAAVNSTMAPLNPTVAVGATVAVTEPGFAVTNEVR